MAQATPSTVVTLLPLPPERISLHRNETQNFAHILKLKSLGSEVATAVDRLAEAEAFCTTSPAVTEMLCRTAAELVAVAISTNEKLEKQGLTHIGRFRALEDHFAKKGNPQLANAFREFAIRVKQWSVTVHGRRKPDADAAIASLRAFHCVSTQLCHGLGIAEPKPFERPIDLSERYARQYEQEQVSLQTSLEELRTSAESARREATRLGYQLASQNSLASTEREGVQRKLEDARATATAYEEEQLRLMERIKGLEGERGALESALAAERTRLREASEQNARSAADAALAIATAESAHKHLESAKQENQRLKNEQARFSSASYREVLERSNAQIVKLEQEKTAAESARKTAEARHKDGDESIARLETMISALEDKVDKATKDERRRKEQERRSNRYSKQYPSPSASTRTSSDADCRRFANAVGTFFRESLLDKSGPMSPFAKLTQIEPLSPDPYAERYSALHPDGHCLVRILRAESDRDGVEVLRSWEIERAAVEKLYHARTRGTTVSIIDKAEYARPGFVVLLHPDIQTLTTYGHGGHTAGLVTALRFVESLLERLVEHVELEITSAWPDCRTLGIRGSEAVLLEPTAMHAGDLGPTELRALDPESIRTLPRDHIERTWVHVLAHSFVRIIGHVPTDSVTCPEQRQVHPDVLRTHLEQLRRTEQQPINLEPLRQLAKATAAALLPTPRERPAYAAFVSLLSATLQQ